MPGLKFICLGLNIKALGHYAFPNANMSIKDPVLVLLIVFVCIGQPGPIK